MEIKYPLHTGALMQEVYLSWRLSISAYAINQLYVTVVADPVYHAYFRLKMHTDRS